MSERTPSFWSFSQGSHMVLTDAGFLMHRSYNGLAHFYNTIKELLEDPKENDEVEQLLMWWNR